jgi:hypothetical protein
MYYHWLWRQRRQICLMSRDFQEYENGNKDEPKVQQNMGFAWLIVALLFFRGPFSRTLYYSELFLLCVLYYIATWAGACTWRLYRWYQTTFYTYPPSHLLVFVWFKSIVISRQYLPESGLLAKTELRAVTLIFHHYYGGTRAQDSMQSFLHSTRSSQSHLYIAFSSSISSYRSGRI